LQTYALPSVGGQPSRSQRIYLQLWDTAGQERCIFACVQ